MREQRPVIYTMFISFLLLVGFVAFWLTQQYQNAEVQLRKQLKEVVADTEKQMIDSLLIKSVLNPLLLKRAFPNNTLGLVNDSVSEFSSLTVKHSSSGVPSFEKKWTDNSQVITNNDTSRHTEIKVEVNFDSVMSSVKLNSKSAKKRVVIAQNFSTSDLNPEGGELNFPSLNNDSNTTFLLQGLNLLVNELASGSKGLFDSTGNFMIAPDSVVLDSLLKMKLEDLGIKAPVYWRKFLPDSLQNSNASGISTAAFYPNYSIYMPNVVGYLIGVIWAEIAFVIFMLGITALAFFLAYRNIKRQQLLNEMKNDLISNMSHELKTPVSTVKVALEALADERVNMNKEILDDYLSMANSELLRLEGLLEKVLNMNALDKNLSILSKETVDLAALVREASNYQKLGLDGLLSITITEMPETAVYVKGDRLHLQGVIFNILENASKYAGPSCEVELSLQVKQNSAVVKIADNGPGVEGQFRQRIFDKFFRIGTGNVHNVKGYGLGLSYCFQVMKLHEGSIECKSQPEGTGCIFELTFPI